MGEPRLTARQRRFVIAYVSGGCANGSAAAREAGYTGSDAAIAVTASRLIRLAKVRTAIEGLTGKAIQRAERGAIASLQECLEFLTTVKRSRLGDFIGGDGEPTVDKIREAPEGLVRKLKIKSTTDAEGQVYAQHELELESALEATRTLVKHYHDQDEGKRTEGLFAQVLKAQPPAVVAALARAMLAGPRPIEIKAKVIA